MVSDERTIKRRAGRLFPEAIRADVTALFRIVDRTMATFLRVRVLLAVVAGFLIWAGLSIASELGFGPTTMRSQLPCCLGVLQLIPELGFFLGFFPVLLAFAIGGPASGLVALACLRRARSSSPLPSSRPACRAAFSTCTPAC